MDLNCADSSLERSIFISVVAVLLVVIVIFAVADIDFITQIVGAIIFLQIWLFWQIKLKCYTPAFISYNK